MSLLLTNYVIKYMACPSGGGTDKFMQRFI